MKKILTLFFILLVLFIGVMIGSDPSMGRAANIKEKTKKFEEEIVIPGNDYHYDENVVTPNLNNKIARTGENIIKGIFSFSFDALKNVLE
ncbi:MAG TPA: hypothetical protein GXZ48_05645 [Acholeplasmataceae bacterium]|nr:hypothetical protein [Acholeplasmataceae bacterium]